MAAYARSVVSVTAALFVLSQLCSANGPTVQIISERNKVTGPSINSIPRKTKLQRSGGTSKVGEFSARPDSLVHDLPGTCTNLSGDEKQLRDEFFRYIVKQLSKPLPRQEIRKTPARPKIGAKRIIVKPIAANYMKNSQKFSLNVSDIQKTPVGIKFWLFDKEKRCIRSSSIKIAVLNKMKETKNYTRAIKKRYHEFVSGQYFNSKGERWVVFDVSSVIARVLRNVRKSYKSMDTAKLVIVVKNKCPSSKVRIQNSRQSYIEITANDRAPALDCTPGEVRCCWQPIAVTEGDLLSKGFSLIAPRMFNTGYCKGTCEGHAGGRRCCTPTKTVSFHYIYAHNRLFKKSVADNVIECGCR